MSDSESGFGGSEAGLDAHHAWAQRVLGELDKNLLSKPKPNLFPKAGLQRTNTTQLLMDFGWLSLPGRT